jgi:hypothetical protein
VAGGDGGLQLVRAGTALGERRLDQRPSLGHAAPVPPAAVLVSEQDKRAVLVSAGGVELLHATETGSGRIPTFS